MWMQPASSNAALCAALLIIAAAIQSGPRNISLSNTDRQPGTVHSDLEDSQFWHHSSIRDVLPSALARALVSQDSMQDGSGEAAQDMERILLARVHCLVQQDSVVSALLHAIPEEVNIAR